MTALAWLVILTPSTDEAIFDILEEETSVMLSSRRKESAQLAASMVTVVDREHIERQGARYLYQILQSVVGFTVTKTEYNTWRVGDLVLWDNRCTMHRRDPFDASSRRIMHRTQMKGQARPVA